MSAAADRRESARQRAVGVPACSAAAQNSSRLRVAGRVAEFEERLGPQQLQIGPIGLVEPIELVEHAEASCGGAGRPRGVVQGEQRVDQCVGVAAAAGEGDRLLGDRTGPGHRLGRHRVQQRPGERCRDVGALDVGVRGEGGGDRFEQRDLGVSFG